MLMQIDQRLAEREWLTVPTHAAWTPASLSGQLQLASQGIVGRQTEYY